MVRSVQSPMQGMDSDSLPASGPDLHALVSSITSCSAQKVGVWIRCEAADMFPHPLNFLMLEYFPSDLCPPLPVEEII